MRHAFTLIELLVVIVIIAILAGLMLPVIGQARAMGKLVACSSQLRQVTACTLVYAQDNNDHLMRAVGTEGFLMSQAGEVGGFGLLLTSGILDNPKLLYCTDVTLRDRHDVTKPPGGVETSAHKRYRDDVRPWMLSENTRSDYTIGWGALISDYTKPEVIDAAKQMTVSAYSAWIDKEEWGPRRYWLADSYDHFGENSTYAKLSHANVRRMNIGGVDGSVKTLPRWDQMLNGATDERSYYWPYNDRSDFGFWRWVGAGQGF